MKTNFLPADQYPGPLMEENKKLREMLEIYEQEFLDIKQDLEFSFGEKAESMSAWARADRWVQKES